MAREFSRDADMDKADFEKRRGDCFELYRKFGGRKITRIEREMRALGHQKFSRRILYSRVERGVYKPGWIERFGWRETLQSAGFSPYERDESRTLNERDKSRTLNERDKSRTLNERDESRTLNGFHAWLKSVSPNMHWDWKHQKYIYKYLERVTSGDCRRLMIFLPPRHGKSELVTVRYAAWRLSQDPSLNVILGSYNQRLANRFSRKVRRVLGETGSGVQSAGFSPYKRDESSTLNERDESRTLNGYERDESRTLNKFANSEAEWETRAGGGLRAVGVGGGVTGFGASLIVIDDPVKSRAEAESETFRDNLWDWFNDDLYTRLEPNGSIILIQTRWHEDDLAGRLLKEMENGGEHWDVISLPATAEPSVQSAGFSPCERDKSRTLNERDESRTLNTDPLGRSPGQALCPERYDEKALEKLRRQLGSYSFSALYQQRPVPAEGGLFKRKWLRQIVDAAPPGLKWKRGYDLAVSTRTTASFTASFRCAFDKSGNLYIADGFRKRIEFPEQRRYIIDRLMQERDTEHGIELALHGQAVIQDLRRESGVRSTAFRGVKVETDKLTRALAWANLAEEGKVVLVRGPWNQDFIEEACQFPRGHFDDQIDAVSLAVKMSTEQKYKHYGF